MGNREAYISGIGQSEVGVRLARHPLLLTLDAINEALADAGLTIEQIDGVFTYPGKMSSFLGFSPVSSDDVIEALGIKSKWHLGGGEQPAQLAAIASAALAVKEGLCRHAICFRTVYEAAALSRPEEFPPLKRDFVDGMSQWTAPFWAFSAACWTAQYAMRHMHRYGMTREQLAQIAGIERGATILDAGSGLGGPSRYLASTYGCRVIGVDLTPSFVAVAQLLAQRTGLNTLVSYQIGDLLALPFPDSCFDAVWTQHVVMNIPDRERVYREFRRVLKPGGKLAFYDVLATDCQSGTALSGAVGRE